VELELLHDRPDRQHFFKSSSIGGIKSAILGTIEIVALASAIAIPIGIGVAVWLVEYGKSSWFAHTVRFFVDVLTGVPSIVFGLFIYIVLIVGTGSTYAGYKGSLALSLLMLPVVIRSAEVILLLVPERAARVGARARRAALAGDLQHRAADGAAGHGHRRAAGDRPRRRRDRAAAVHRGRHARNDLQPGQFMNSLPVQIYNDVTSPTTAVVNRAWGAALTLVVMILLLNLIARLIARRSRLA
jgi:phosphate transport system permease protein